MRRRCLTCGAEFEGRQDAILCPACAQASKDSTHIRPRTCRQCGAIFPGGPRAWYCPVCRRERRREADRRHKRQGPKRPLGSMDVCPICGKEYVVTGGLQKYCPACAPEAIRAIDRQQSMAWNREHIDIDRQREQRQEATAEIPCVICGKPFKPDAPALTCSPECAAELRRQTHARWEAAHKDQRCDYHRRNYAENKGKK